MKNSALFIHRLGLLSSITLCLAACTPTISQRGNMVEDYQISEVVKGVHTKTDVLRIMGSPTTTAPFDDSRWYYIGQEMQKRGILDPAVTQERIILVSFDANAVVQSIEDIDNQRLNIPVEDKKTATYGNDITVFQQLIGNLGRFNNQTPE